MERFQEAKMNMGKRTKLQWVMHVLGLAAVQSARGIGYVIRRALP
jgi:hypothetical protein